MQTHGQGVVSGHLGQDRHRELRRSGPVVTPSEADGAVVEQLQPEGNLRGRPRRARGQSRTSPGTASASPRKTKSITPPAPPPREQVLDRLGSPLATPGRLDAAPGQLGRDRLRPLLTELDGSVLRQSVYPGHVIRVGEVGLRSAPRVAIRCCHHGRLASEACVGTHLPFGFSREPEIGYASEDTDYKQAHPNRPDRDAFGFHRPLPSECHFGALLKLRCNDPRAQPDRVSPASVGASSATRPPSGLLEPPGRASAAGPSRARPLPQADRPLRHRSRQLGWGPPGDDAYALPGLGVVAEQREVALELDDACELAALVIGVADRFSGGFLHGEHAASGWD